MSIFKRLKKGKVLFVLRVPESIILAEDKQSAAYLEQYKQLVKNVANNVDDGIILPSTKYPPEEGGGDMYHLDILYLDY